MITKLDNNFLVETWWDRQSRLWITQVLNSNLYQQGDALFAGNRESAKADHRYAIELASTGEINE